MKYDKRYLKTEKLIREAFFELLKTESYNKITVDKLCEKAFIGKNTFYAHYKNKDELLFSIINEFSCDYVLFYKNNDIVPDMNDDHSVETFIEAFFLILKNHIEEYSLLMKNDNQINFSERLLISGRNYFIDYLEKVSGSKVTDIKTILLMDSLAAATIRLQKGYILHQNEVSFDDVVDLAKTCYKDIVKKINTFPSA